MIRPIERAISIYRRIIGESAYYCDPSNWKDVSKIYFTGNDGFIAILGDCRTKINIWMIVYNKTFVLRLLMNELAKDSFGNKLYILNIKNRSENSIISARTSDWFRTMGLIPVYHRDGQISIEFDSNLLREKFIFDTS